MKTKVWIWIVAAVVLLALGFLFFGGNAEPSYDLNAPGVIAITKGTEGSISGLEIGVTFVDSGSAGLSIFTGYDANGESSTAQQAILEEEETVLIGEHQIKLLDAIPSQDTAVLQVTIIN